MGGNRCNWSTKKSAVLYTLPFSLIIVAASIGVLTTASSVVTDTNEPVHRMNVNLGTVVGLNVRSGIGTVIATIPVGQLPIGVEVDAYSGQVFVVNSGGDNVTVIDGASNTVAKSISVGPSPYHIGLDEVTNTLYVSHPSSRLGNLTIINGTTDTTTGSILISDPNEVAWDSSNGYLYVSTPLSNLTVVNPTTTKTVTTLSVGTTPMGVLVDPMNGEVYVANGNSNNVSVINATTDKVVKSIPAGYFPNAIALDTSNEYLYVANDDNGCSVTCIYNVTVIDGRNNSVVGWIPTGSAPMSVAYDSANGDIYVANGFGQNVTVINGSSDQVIGSIRVGTSPDGIAYDPVNHDLYVANGYTNNLTVIGTGAPPPPSITSFSAFPSTVPLGDLTHLNVSAFGGSGTLAYTYTGLPSGCSSTDTSSLACKPAAIGTYTVRVYANDTTSHSANATTVLTVIPVLSGVTLNPASSTVKVNQTVSFIATPTCQGGPCPSGITYAWMVNNSLGRLIPSTGAYANFTAGPSPGSSMLTLTASQGTTTEQATADVTITGISIPILNSVTINPTSVSLNTSSTYTFIASASCTPNSCSTGVSYAWALNNSLGSVAPTTGFSTEFTSGPSGGTVTLTVTASWNGVTKWANATVAISSPTGISLTGVTISPSKVALQVGANANFTVSPICGGGTCPSAVTYSWSLNNKLATLNSSTGYPVRLVAGNMVGTVTLFVNATLHGVTKEGTATITISQSIAPPTNNTPPSTFLGLSGYDGYILIGVIVAAVVAATAALVFLKGRKKKGIPGYGV